MKTIKKFGEFNQRRYGNPWVAIVDAKTGKPDFSTRVGGYTGGYGKGEAGELFVAEPVEGAVYMYGMKDYRGNNSFSEYVKYVGGEFVRIEKTELVAAMR